MQIERIELGELKVPLHTPFKTSLRTVDAVHDVVVRIHTKSGHIGYGEAPPTAVITGETRASIRAAVEEYIAPKLMGRDARAMEDNQEILHAAILGNTSAKAAIDMALYDLWAQSMVVPLYRALGGSSGTLETDLTISVNSVEEMTRDAVIAVERGFHVLKVKLGLDEALDIARVQSIRQAVGEDVVVRLDANQGWTLKEALSITDKLDGLGLNIELIEQPLHYSDLHGMIELTRVSRIPIMADESVFSPAQALEVIRLRAADILNIKLMKTGGIYKALQITSLAKMHGIACMIGCMLESSISVGAASHLAAARPIIQYVDLDGPSLCKENPVVGGTDFEEERITLNETPGLGIQEVKGFVAYE